MDGTTDHMGPVADPANRAVRLAASVCVWDMEIPVSLLSLYGRVHVVHKINHLGTLGLAGFMGGRQNKKT